MRNSGGDDSYCPACGEVLEPSDHFCPQCGQENPAAGPPPDVARQQSGRENPAANGGWEAAGNEAGQRERRGRRGQQRPRRRDRSPQPQQDDSRAPPGLPGVRRDNEAGWKPVLVGFGLAALSIGLLLVFTLLSSPLILVLGLSTGAGLIVGAAMGQYFGFFGLALAYLRYTREFSWDDVKSYLGVRVPSLKEIGMVFVGYVGILGSMILISIVISLLELQSADNESADQLAESAGTDPLLIAGVFALMFLVVGPCEEILYRGVIQNRLRERFSKVPGIIAASIIFASVHVVALGSTDPIAILTTLSILAVTSLSLGAVYEYTGNLVVPWLLHSLHNSILLSAVFFAPGGESSVLLPALTAVPL
jgi:membrane protease YdiL (CAAX protease family)